MSDQTSTTRKPAETGEALPEMPFSLDMMMGLNGQGFDTAKDLRETTAAGMQSWNEGISRFVTARIEQDMEFMRSLMSCRSPREVTECEVAFMQKAIMQYAEQTSHMLGLAARLQEQYWSGIEAASKPKKTAH